MWVDDPWMDWPELKWRLSENCVKDRDAHYFQREINWKNAHEVFTDLFFELFAEVFTRVFHRGFHREFSGKFSLKVSRKWSEKVLLTFSPIISAGASKVGVVCSKPMASDCPSLKFLTVLMFITTGLFKFVFMLEKREPHNRGTALSADLSPV